MLNSLRVKLLNMLARAQKVWYIVVSHGLWMGVQSLHEVRRGVEDGAALGLDELQGLGRVVAVLQL